MDELTSERPLSEPAEARKWTVSILPHLGPSGLQRTTSVVSELVTAAVMLGAEDIQASLHAEEGTIRFTAEGERQPRPLEVVHPLGERTCRVLNGLTQQWGFDVQAEHVTLWALIPATEGVAAIA